MGPITSGPGAYAQRPTNHSSPRMTIRSLRGQGIINLA